MDSGKACTFCGFVRLRSMCFCEDFILFLSRARLLFLFRRLPVELMSCGHFFVEKGFNNYLSTFELLASEDSAFKGYSPLGDIGNPQAM